MMQLLIVYPCMKLNKFFYSTKILLIKKFIMELIFSLAEIFDANTKTIFEGDKSIVVSEDDAISRTKSEKFKLLIVEPMTAWQEVVMESVDCLYNLKKCDKAQNYEETIKLILNNKYSFIFLSQDKQWRKILKYLMRNVPNIPVIFMHTLPIEDVENIKAKYPNVIKLIFKGNVEFESVLHQTILNLFNSANFNCRKQT